MKQTNNAIKFLLAQYRAIFKHAYLKGLASAVIMTAGLAAGSNAHAVLSAADNFGVAESGGTITITATESTPSVNEYDALTVEVDTSTTNKNTMTGTINIVNGTNTITGGAESAQLNTSNSQKGIITVSGSSVSLEFAAGTTDNYSLAAYLDTVSASGSSELKVTATDKGASTLNVNTLTLENATLTISGDTTNAATVSGSTISLRDKATVDFAGNAVLEGVLDGQGGTLNFESGSGTIKAVSYYGDGDTTITNPGTETNLTVGAGKTATVALTPKTVGSVKYRGVLSFGKDSKIDLQQAASSGGGILQITSGSGSVGSIVEIQSGAILTSTGAASGTSVGTIKVAGNSTATVESDYSELRIDAGVLSSFLTADKPGTAESDDFAGAVELGATSVLQLTNGSTPLTVELGGVDETSFDSKENQLDLALDSGAASTKGGKVFVSGSSTLKVDSVKVSGAVKSSGSLSGLTVEAGNVTLGATGFKSSDTAASGVNEHGLYNLEFETQNTLNLVAGTEDKGAYTLLSGTVTLQGSRYAQDSNGYNNHSQENTAKELISGSNLILGKAGSLEVQGGNWQTDKDITLASGTFTVTSVKQSGLTATSNKADDGDYSLVKLKGGLNLTSGSLNVTGASGANAVLDLTGAQVAFNETTAAAITLSGDNIEVYDANNNPLDEDAGYGVLVLTGKTLSDYVKEDNDGKVYKTTLSVGSGGVLYVSEPDIGTYDFGDISSGSSSAAAAGVVSLTGAGYVVFDGNVKLANQDTTQDKALNLGNGTIVADTITLNNEHQTEKDGKKTNDPVTIVNGTSGGLIVHTGLKSTTSSEFLLGSGSSGANLTFTTDAGQAGTVAVDLTTNGTGTNKLDFNGGDWTVKNIDLATGTGADELTIADSGADATLTTVTGNNLKAGASDEVTVNAQGSATFATAQLTSAAKINVSGDLTLTGKKDIAEDDVAYNQGLAGVDLSGASITVDNGGVLTLGDAVLAAKDSITVKNDDDIPTVTINNALKATSLKVEQGGELVLGMSADTSTAIFGTDGLSAEEAVALKKGLFGDNYATQLEGILNLGDSKLNITWTDEAHTQTTWDNVQDFADITGGDVTTNELKQALITEVSSTDKVSGQYGAMQVDDSFLGGQSVQVDNDFGLHNAYNVGGTDYYLFKEDESGKVVAIGVEATSSDMTLAGGGHIGAVSVDKGDLSVIGGGETVFEGNVSVTGSTGAEISSFNVAAQTTASVSGDVTTTGLELAGNLNVSGKTTIQEYGEIATGSQLTTKDLTLSKGDSATETVDVDIMGNVDVSNALTLNEYTAVNIMGGTLITKTTTLASDAVLNVGYEVDSDIQADDPNTIFDDTQSYTAAYQTEQLKLNGGSLIVDPAYDQPAAFAAVYNLNSITDGDITDIKAGIADGKIYVGQNSVLGIGVKTLEDLKNATASYMYGQSLSADDIGAVLYMNKQFTIGQDGSVVLTALSQEKFLEHYNAGNGTGTDLSTVTDPALKNTLYLGGNTALAITADVASNSLATGDSAMIEFADANGKVIADGGQINLTGNVRATDYQVFGDADGTVTITLLNGGTYDPEGDYAINISTENGVLVGVVGADGKTSLGIAPDARAKLSGASDPVYTSLVAYANGYNGDDPDNADAKLYYGLDQDGNKKTAYNNDVLQYSISTGNGADTEHVARLGVYAGAAQAAISAGASTYEAVSGRMGVGAQNGSVVFADNGQGAGLWVTPIYKNHDSDGFDAQGLSYGADMDMYGVALGGDFTMANGLRVGAAFNVGSGDADGQGAGAGVSNDFDYYGFSVYGGYTLDKLSIVGDISYTVVDNDAEANTGLGKATTSLDTSNLSVGVTGQYTFNLNAVDVTPHAGLRYTYIDMDDYTVKVDGSEQARYAADSMSIFSIPVGVTFSKDIASGDWTIKPTFDLTLSANVGDDSMDGSVTWAGVDNLTTKLESEVIDNFTYGATLGVAAKTGNFSFGLGVNYTGASSADEYGVSANARFVF